MARKPRLEFAGAVYHVLSWGDYRKGIFEEGGSATAFEEALFEACEKSGWRMHAYVIMPNHFHVALETPQPNLVEGMRWLQGTFGIRFNAFHGERGHVFRERYKSLVVEPGRTLAGLVNYIHLNPVRAGVVSLAGLLDHRWSSLPKFLSRKPRWPLVRSGFLGALDFPDSPTGMAQYLRHLEPLEEADGQRLEELARRYCQGWALGSADFRRELTKRFADMREATGWRGTDVAEMREEKWERIVRAELTQAGKTEGDVQTALKSAPWKIRIARRLQRETTATNAWIARRLSMGHPVRMGNTVRTFNLWAWYLFNTPSEAGGRARRALARLAASVEC